MAEAGEEVRGVRVVGAELRVVDGDGALVRGEGLVALLETCQRVAEGGEEAGLAISETSRAIAAAATKAPTTATERMSQRLGPVEGCPPAGAPGWVTGNVTGGLAGPAEACPRDGGRERSCRSFPEP